MTRSPEASEMWKELYPRLTEDRFGIVGTITARAEAQVMRLACIYALLDQKIIVTTDHLRAGAAMWDYCDRSAQYIFRDLTGSSDADKILEAIRSSLNGLSRTQIRDVLGRNKSSRTIDELLARLERDGPGRQGDRHEHRRSPRRRLPSCAPQMMLNAEPDAYDIRPKSDPETTSVVCRSTQLVPDRRRGRRE
jgi:hypothetical protein